LADVGVITGGVVVVDDNKSIGQAKLRSLGHNKRVIIEMIEQQK
jgi:hypothetical protein